VKFCFRKLILRGGGLGHDVHAAAVLVELHLAVHERKERPIAARADVLARDEFAAALADDDAARADDFAAKFFYAQPFADAVAPVADAALTFFMCHKMLSVDRRDLYHSQFLAMADGLVITLAAFHLEREFFLAALVLDNICHDGRAADGGRADGELAAVVDEQHAVERDRLARLDFKAFDFELVACGDAILFAACF
jgi:hypothetical protein